MRPRYGGRKGGAVGRAWRRLEKAARDAGVAPPEPDDLGDVDEAFVEDLEAPGDDEALDDAAEDIDLDERDEL